MAINTNPLTKKSIKTIIVITVLIIFMVIYVYNYNQTYNIGHEINYTFDGIRYQANNINTGSPVKITINGVYEKEYGSKYYIFEGDITIDGEVCSFVSGNNIYPFNEDNLSSLKSNSINGNFFISDKMEEITIMLSTPTQDGGSRFSYKDGWLISAPCKSRSEAVEISNKLIQQKYKNINIK